MSENNLTREQIYRKYLIAKDGIKDCYDRTTPHGAAQYDQHLERIWDYYTKLVDKNEGAKP